AVVAMLASNALVAKSRWAAVRTAAFFPLALAIGLVAATLAGGERLYQVIGFAAALFGAVWVRRFGTDWFFYGFMAWMGFFFATFLQATWSLVPELVLAAVVSTVWVVLLLTTLFRSVPRRVLHSTLAACFARGRATARACAELLEARDAGPRAQERARRQVAAQLAGLGDAALLAEAWSAEPDALPEGWSATAVRRRMIETQQAVERIAGASGALLGASDELVGEARRALEHLGRRRDLAAAVATERLDTLVERARTDGDDDWWPARHLAFGVREFLRFDAEADEPPGVDPGEEEFEAVTGLVFGNLPGAPSVARDVATRGSRWNPLTRLSMTSRQAVQVMLAGLIAIGLGTWLSPTRYYWAVIAVFVTFTGTGTRSETFLKGVARISGTLVGLVAAIALAHVTAGHTVAIFSTILLSIFLAFYLVKVSYTAMTFFITILLGQLYSVIGTLSDQLLELRLGETAVGAVVGVLVAMLFAPLSTRDTVRSARDELLVTLEALLVGVASYAGGERVDLDALSRALDDRARRVALVAKPLVGPLGRGSASRRTRRRLGLYVAAVAQARALVLSLQRRAVARPDTIVAAARALADAVRALLSADIGEGAPHAGEPLWRSDVALFGDHESARDGDPVVRHLHHLGATLTELAETGLGVAAP
ncbi:MAG: hypothetical protein JWO76_1751, partial [Nocardioides sp.]|nr:hypothetical protein [Nocardioides sp.]